MQKLKSSALLILSIVAIILIASCKDGDIVDSLTTTDEAVSGFFMMDENTPINAAKLEITDMDGNLLYTGITKDDGNFVIEKENVPQNADNYVVTFSKNEKVIQQMKLNTLVETSRTSAGKGNVFLGDEYEYNLTWTIKIVNQETKEPIENAVYKLGTARDGSGTMYEYVSDTEGIITLKLIDGCYYPKLTISKEGYLEYQRNEWGLRRTSTDNDIETPVFALEPVLTPDNTTDNKITVILLRSKMRLDGSIGGAEYPLCGRKVIIKGDNGFIDSAYTGIFEDGNYEEGHMAAGEVIFQGLKSGVYTISHEATVGEYETAQQTVQVAGNKTKGIYLIHVENLNRCKNNVLIVKFKDEKGNPITNATAKAQAIGVANEWGGNVTIEDGGRAVFANVQQTKRGDILIECIYCHYNL